ncbi:MAG: hypothetical protein ABW252_12670 [Polyangiales bacterium]
MIRRTSLPFSTRASRLALATTLALAACGGDEPDGIDEVVTGKTGAPAAHEVDGFVSGVRNGPPIAGAEVCVVDADDVPCATSDATGRYVLRLPVWKKRRELAVHVKAPGYVDFVGMVRESPRLDGKAGEARGWWQHSIDLFNDAALADVDRESPRGKPIPGRGIVLVDVWYRVTGTPEGERVHFAGSNPTDGRGAFVPKSGQVLFTDVAPGRFELKVEGCTPAAELPGVWKSATRDAVAGLVLPGALTRLTLRCQEERAPAKPREGTVLDL